MEKEERSQRACKTMEPEVFLQWGNRKRLRCVRVKDPQKISHKLNDVVRRRITSRLLDKESSPFSQYNHRLSRNSEAAILRSGTPEHRKAWSPEKEDRYYTTRGSAAVVGLVDENGKIAVDSSNHGEDKKGAVWPKLYITLSSKEKEEDFMAMKGCKPSQRPKKRAKIIQRSLLLVSPGAWLTDMCQERYEVREKKSSKKRPRGLKAMGVWKVIQIEDYMPWQRQQQQLWSFGSIFTAVDVNGLVKRLEGGKNVEEFTVSAC